MRHFGVAARWVGLRAHDFRFSVRTASELPSAGWFFCLPLRRLPLGGLAFGLTTSAFRHAPLRDCRSAGWFFCLPFRRLPLGELVLLPSVSAFATRRVGASAFRFGVALGGLAFGLIASAFRHAPLRRLQLGGLAFGLTASAFRHAPLRDCPRRVGLRAHGFCFSACADPHRLTAEARAGGTHRHDTCFTSKHLSQHVNLPHRSP